jgi:hypothetical protein
MKKSANVFFYGIILSFASSSYAQDLFPEKCVNMYFNKSYRELIANPLGVISKISKGEPGIKTTIHNESNNYGTCYANACSNIFEGQYVKPHPLNLALLYKLKYEPEKNDIKGGWMTETLQAVNDEGYICERDIFNNFYKFNNKNPADMFFNNVINMKLVSREFFPPSWNEKLISFFESEIASEISLLKNSSDNTLKVQWQILKKMCKNAEAWVENPFYGKISVNEVKFEKAYSGRGIDNLLRDKNLSVYNSKIERTNEDKRDEIFFIPNSATDQAAAAYSLVDPNNKNENHAYIVLGTRYQTELFNEDNNGNKASIFKPQCQLVMKDSNPHTNDEKCKTNLYPTKDGAAAKIYDPLNQACYIFYSYHLLKKEQKIVSYTSVTINDN